ncbi:hypothetical protein TCDM_12190 [Trypanosoma cruzi Dm28c]|uniref:Uncharacterized protein n=1 Tax=Trypanosoma cruzi Dm28c TaxID=1416333 RepID=V5AI13_TRYCR|nr:hypothetical protein TCDM_12190 [Trypanosoma cruzi Dm28c]
MCYTVAVLTVSSSFLGVFLPISFLITHGGGKQALIATVEFEGTERTNSTHTAHTHIFICSHVLLLSWHSTLTTVAA